MSKKKLLNESTIRRFGGLAGIKPATTSNFLSEMGEIPYERDDEDEAYGRDDMMQEEEEEELDAEVEMDVEEEPVEDEPPMEEPAAEGGEADELVMSLLSKVSEWAADHGVDMDVEEDGEAEGGEEEMGMEMELDVDEAGGEEEMGAEEDVSLQEMIASMLSEEAEEEVIEEEDGDMKGDKSKTDKEDKDYVGKDNPKESIQVIDDQELVQEVAKRVKKRLAQIAKSQRQKK